MRIKKIYYYDQISKLKVNVDNFDKFTLLVGISGAGKTQILNVFKTLKNVIEGETENLEGIEWDVSFEINNKEHRWTGRFIRSRQTSKYSRYFTKSSNNPILPRFAEEKLYIDNEIVFNRDSEITHYREFKTPKISLNSSVISIFSEEKEIKPIFNGFKKIYNLNYEEERRYVLPHSDIIESSKNKKYSELNFLVQAHAPLIFKLAILYNNFPNEFKSIKNTFISIFPKVTDIKFSSEIEDDLYFLCIKEKGTDWIPQINFSSGMYKTLMLISELHLLENGSVILLDEIENSLGVNCIDDIIEIMLFSERNIQFILTSHHPYIINNIDVEYWKIVTRDGSSVKVINSEEAEIGYSNHNSFKQLLNLDIYRS